MFSFFTEHLPFHILKKKPFEIAIWSKLSGIRLGKQFFLKVKLFDLGFRSITPCITKIITLSSSDCFS